MTAVRSESIGTTSALQGLEFRLARDDARDAAEFCRLSNSLYARKVDEAYYRWQFFRAPYPCLLAMALDGRQRAIGCYGVQLRPTVHAGQSLAMALDIMVAADHQGQGLFRPLAEFALEAAVAHRPLAAFVMANARAHRAHLRHLGWKPVSTFYDWVRPTAGATDQLAGRIAVEPVSELTDEDARLCAAIDAARAGRAVLAGGAPRPCSGLAPLRISPSLSFSRSARILRWRLLENPRYRYEILRCRSGGELRGLVALKTFRDPATGRSTGDIIEVLAVPETTGATRAGGPIFAEAATGADDLLLAALARFESQNVAEAATWLATNTMLDASGRRLGFRRIDRPRYLSCRVLDPRQTAWEQAELWSVSMMDIDLY